MNYHLVEALRKAVNTLPRYSFLLNAAGGVSRVQDRFGHWIEWYEVHKLFDAEVVDGLTKELPQAESQSVRTKDDVPTERAVLEREWRAMRLELATWATANAEKVNQAVLAERKACAEVCLQYAREAEVDTESTLYGEMHANTARVLAASIERRST